MGVKEREDTIHVQNFPYHFEESDMRKLLKDCGEIVKITMPQDWQTKQSSGYGYVKFAEEKCARKAVNLDGIKIMHRKIKIRIAKSKPEYKKASNNTDRRDHHRSRDDKRNDSKRMRNERIDKDRRNRRSRSRS